MPQEAPRTAGWTRPGADDRWRQVS